MIRDFEAEGLGYAIGNAGELCFPGIQDIRCQPTLLAAFKRGWRSGVRDRRKGKSKICPFCHCEDCEARKSFQ